MEKQEGKNLKLIKIKNILLGIFIFLFCFLLLGMIYVYRFNNSNNIPNFVLNRIFFPAAVINGKDFITIGGVNQNLLSIKSFYENQDFSSLGLRVDFTTEEGKKRLKIREKELLNKMIEDKIVESLAKERGIKITTKNVKDNVERKMTEYGNEEKIRENLKNLYGWNISDFEEKIVKPSLYRDALAKWLDENDGKNKKQEAQKSALETKEKLKNDGNFDEIIKEMENNPSSQMGGKLGWFKEEQIASEIRKAVISLEKSEISDVLESSQGYHIVRLDDLREKDGEKIYDISQLFFPKISLANWLDKEIRSKKVIILLADYNWNKEMGIVEFKDEKMRAFEEKSMKEANSDPSLVSF